MQKCSQNNDNMNSQSALDQMFELHKQFKMPAANENLHSHRKEFYGFGEMVDSKMCLYKGRIYYKNSGYLCSSDCNGNNINILYKIDSHYEYIYVNITGIYMYSYDKKLDVCHLDFTGNVISRFEDKYEYNGRCQVNDIYIYDNRVYYSISDTQGEEKGEPAKIKCTYIDEKRTDTIYNKTGCYCIERLFATDKKIIFWANYYHYNGLGNKCDDSGWMILDLQIKYTECLSNPYCSPENVVDNPNVYDCESSFYIPGYDDYRRNIAFFDLDRDLFWVQRYAKDNHKAAYLEPRALWGNRDAIVPNLPVFKADSGSREMRCQRIGTREYFDGYVYYKCGDYHFSSCDMYGKKEKDSWDKHMEGYPAYNVFSVMGNYLFLDLAVGSGYGKIFKLSTKPEPIRKSWFHFELPHEALKKFKQKSALADTLKHISDSQRQEIADHDLETEKVLGKTDIKYNICTFGANFHIGFGVQLIIKINGYKYNCKTHKSSKGRIDGMKKIYMDNNIKLGDRLYARYSAAQNVLFLKKI